jgi:tetratricopeptide (TPR) repeat protein
MQLARQAVHEDPSFAAAHTWLAWTMMRNLERRDEYVNAAARAVQLSSHTTEGERLWILGSHYTMLGADDRAIGAYEALLQIYPDHDWALNNLAIFYRDRERDAAAAVLAKRLLEIRPNAREFQYLVLDSLLRAKEFDDAARYARQIRSGSPADRSSNGLAWVVDAFAAWHRADAATALRELDIAQAEVAHADQALRDAVSTRAAAVYLALGRPDLARAALDTTRQTPDRHMWRALTEYAADEKPFARREARAALGGQPSAERDVDKRVPVRFWMRLSWLLHRTGAEGTGREMAVLFGNVGLSPMTPPDVPVRSIASVLDGEVALANGASRTPCVCCR